MLNNQVQRSTCHIINSFKKKLSFNNVILENCDIDTLCEKFGEKNY